MLGTKILTTHTSPTFEVLPRDLSAYRKGNISIDYAHRFDSGKSGPNVLINAITHGNEFCGMVAVADLLDRQVRPQRGVLTLSFANVEAYSTFDTAKPFESRQLVHNLNRIWDQASLDSNDDSPELRRARAMRPLLDQADHLLDIHSTSNEVPAFWVYQGHERNAALAKAVGIPSIHMVMPAGIGSGTPIIQYGQFGQSNAAKTGLVVECGQHFLTASAQMAKTVVAHYLAYFGMLDSPSDNTTKAAPLRFELLKTYVVKTPNFAFTGAYKGFERFAKGTLIAQDGTEEIRALCDDCTIMMPARVPTVGREAMYLTRPISD
jgi:predicted deacylase